MAQLAFGVVGAVVGGYFGGPQGAAAGWAVGASVGGMLFPSKSNVKTTEGPRLGDLSVSSSAYGYPIAICYGTMRVAGNMIWSSGIIEQRHEKKVKSGKGKGGKSGATQTTVTYTYSASFQMAFAEGPADDVLRIWADSKLIYDRTIGTSGATTKPGLRFRLTDGSETAAPDPVLAAAVPAGRAPGHRGIVTIMFEDLPLEDYGNRIPNITAEITFNKVDEKPILSLDPITAAEGGLLTTFHGGVISLDWSRNVGYLLDHSGATGADVGIRRFNMTTMKEDRHAPVTSIIPADGYGSLNLSRVRDVIGVDPDGYLTIVVGGDGNGTRIIRIEPVSLREVARFGTNDSWPSVFFSSGDFTFIENIVFISAYGASGRNDYLYCEGFYRGIGLLKAREMRYVWHAEEILSGTINGVVAGQAADGFGDGWLLNTSQSTSHTKCHIWRTRVNYSAGVDPLTGESVGVDHRLMAEVMPGAIRAGATAFYGECGAFTYDATDNSLILMAEIADPREPYVFKWREDLGVLWATELPLMINWDNGTFGKARIESSRWTLTRNHRIWQLDTATGALVYDEEWPSEIDEWGEQVYDSVTDTLYIWAASGFKKAFLGRGSGAGDTLASIVADLCARAGLSDGDIDVSELVDVVPGYMLSRQTSVRGAIETLSAAYFFDGVESDDLLKFRKRGRAPALTIASSALVPLRGGAGGGRSDGESWRERRTQEVDLPERVAVLAHNRQNDYQQTVQSAKRISLPLPTMHSRNQISLELPIALDVTTAKRIAEKMLILAWIERSEYECILPPDYLRLDPTDVVTIAFPTGTTFQARATRIDTGADFQLAFRGVSETIAAYTSTVEADGGQGFVSQAIAESMPTFLILPDTPLLRDIDDTGGSGSRIYFAGGGTGAAGWRGAVVYASVDGLTWATAGAIGGEAAYGVTLEALPDPPGSAFCTDESSALRVSMVTGAEQIESVTQEAMVNGANAALLIKHNGEPEAIQFRDALWDEGTASFTLRGLLRGRRGTDVFTSGHTVGETFLLLDPAVIEVAIVPLGDLNASRQWRAVSVGSVFEDAEVQHRTMTGRDLKPYAPWAVKATIDGGDILITWSRRTRIGGELKDGTGTVPLAEASEAYEVDILDEPGGTVLRTLESASESATYAAADILADFGAMPTNLPVVVYQLSAVVGRGFPRAVTLGVS